MNKLPAEISAWYQEIDSGVLFEVVAIDEESDTIEYQHVDGEVGEYDLNTWQQLYLLPAEAPEDWRSSYELSKEDRHGSDQTMIPENMSDPLANIEPDLMDLGDDFHLL
ncbi:MAG: hypothetical protein JKY98_12030 [Gammaproteobacteria bacterium]|nr:hypothetical protein [Gammaproteobacteria bacterium]